MVNGNEHAKQRFYLETGSGLVNGKMMIQAHIYTAAGHRVIMMTPDELERFNSECLDNNEDIRTMITDLRASDENRAISNKN